MGEWLRAPESAWGDDGPSGKAFSEVACTSPSINVHWAWLRKPQKEEEGQVWQAKKAGM